MAKAEPAKKLEVPAWFARLAEPGDMGFVYDSWIRSAHHTYPNQFAVEFCHDERAKVQRIIEGSVVVVAATVADAGELLGHVVYGKWRKTLAVHYAFTKSDARRNGVMKGLVDFANFERDPVVLTAPAMSAEVMGGLVKRYLYDQQVLPLMMRGGR